MDEVRSGSILLTWDAEKRLIVITYEAPIRTTGKDVEPLIEALSRWVGTAGKPFFLLNGCRNLLHMDAECRAAWWNFFRPHRDHAWAALYELNPVIRIVADMFRVATGLRIGVFATEEEARAWLREVGCS